LIIRNGIVIDGTGKERFTADIIVDDGRIQYVGAVDSIEALKEIDASGQIVCPGFIDIHSHSDFPIYVDGYAQSGVRQGLTTLVTGNCGHGPAPAPDKELAKVVTIGYNEDWGIEFAWDTFEEYLDSIFQQGQSTNIAPLVGHGPIRLAAMGFESRNPTSAEQEKMNSLMAEAMEAGAVGMSTGLEYSPGQHASESEITELAKVVASFGGCYASHIRNRGDQFIDGVQEALNIGNKANIPIQLSHLAPRPYAPKGAFDDILEMIESARVKGQLVGIDTFPDRWGPAHLTDLLPPWVHEGEKQDVVRKLRDPKTAEMCQDYLENPTNFLLRLGSFDNFYLTNSKMNSEMLEYSLEEISGLLGLSHIETILKLAGDDGEDFSGVLIRHIFADQIDLDKLLLDPHCSVGSDGAVTSLDGTLSDLIMNRSSFGYAPRFITEYSISRRLVNLEEAIRKLTFLPADSINLQSRGSIEPGMFADIVVFDLEKLQDNSTDQIPQAYPSGIEMVFVNGTIVFENGDHTEKVPGQLVSTRV